MKRLLLVFFCLSLFSTLWSKDVYYVSSSQGNDELDGLTPRTAKRHIAAVPKKNVCVRLKSGDIFFESLSGFTDSSIEKYGNGSKPVLCGFKILKNPRAWQRVGNDIWSIDLSNVSDFTGYGIEEPTNVQLNNIGCIYDFAHDKVYGHIVRRVDSLKRDGDIFTNEYHDAEVVKNHPFRTVYFQYQNNPSTLGNLCFSMASHGVSSMRNCVLKGIAVAGFSKHGMCALNDCLVEDCQIDIIGGAIQVGYEKFVRYGNGIELWANCSNNTITDCLISRTYDTGSTIQATGNFKSCPKNNRFVGNRFYHCRQAFEHFLNPSDKSVLSYVGCEFSNNICYEMGINEFSSPEIRDCNLLSYENVQKDFSITNNIFYGAAYYDGVFVSHSIKKNTVYIYPDQYLRTAHWVQNKNTIMSSDSLGVARYKQLTDDDSEFIVLKRNSRQARTIGKRILKLVGWKRERLPLDKIIKKHLKRIGV